MNKEIREWLQKVKNSNKYEITVDNDHVSVNEINPFEEDTDEWYNFDGEYCNFNMFPEEFLVEVLKWIGIKADRA